LGLLSDVHFDVALVFEKGKRMFNRRMFVALAACVALTASSAFAGGSGGTKKDSTIKVVNKTNNPIYAFVDVSDADILNASMAADPIAAFKALGGKEIAAGGNFAMFSVKAGSHKVTAVDIVEEKPVGTQSVTTSKGKTSVVEFLNV
jgi:hypothetical protein